MLNIHGDMMVYEDSIYSPFYVTDRVTCRDFMQKSLNYFNVIVKAKLSFIKKY